MKEPSIDDLTQSINELNAYKERLKKEISMISKKLRISQEKIENDLQKQVLIKDIDKMVENLHRQIKKVNQNS